MSGPLHAGQSAAGVLPVESGRRCHARHRRQRADLLGRTACLQCNAAVRLVRTLIGALEQIVYNPQLLRGVFTVNSIVPANNQPDSCTTNTDTGFTYAISVMTGATPPGFFVNFHDTQAVGMQTNAVGPPSP